MPQELTEAKMLSERLRSTIENKPNPTIEELQRIANETKQTTEPAEVDIENARKIQEVVDQNPDIHWTQLEDDTGQKLGVIQTVDAPYENGRLGFEKGWRTSIHPENGRLMVLVERMRKDGGVQQSTQLTLENWQLMQSKYSAQETLHRAAEASKGSKQETHEDQESEVETPASVENAVQQDDDTKEKETKVNN